MILAAIMLKIGGYGFLRFSLPITPDASNELDWLIIAMSLIAVVYIGFCRAGAAGHEEADRLFVDRAHGLRHAGVFSSSSPSPGRAGTSTAPNPACRAAWCRWCPWFHLGAMFLCVGVLTTACTAARSDDYGGVVNVMPWFGAFMVFFAMANAGLPGTRASSASSW